jgi:uncharacterized membrane protein
MSAGSKKFDDSKFFDAERLKDLGDGIFAFAMTLLIVTIEMPKVPLGQLRTELLKSTTDMFTFVLTFFLLAIFWMSNHIQTKKLKCADSRLVWINILLFLFVVFVPFSTHLYTYYEGSRLAMLVFNINILLIGTSFLLQWHHIAANRMHHDEFTAEEVGIRYRYAFDLIAVSLLAIAVGWFRPDWSTVVYWLVFLNRIWIRFMLARRAAEALRR